MKKSVSLRTARSRIARLLRVDRHVTSQAERRVERRRDGTDDSLADLRDKVPGVTPENQADAERNATDSADTDRAPGGERPSGQ